MVTPDFITFTTSDGSGVHTVRLNAPVCLYNENDRGYRAARARAARAIKAQLGKHPCSKVAIDPWDWSDAVEALTVQAWA